MKRRAVVWILSSVSLVACDPKPAKGPDPMLVADPAPTDDGLPPGAGTSDFDRGVAYVKRKAYADAIPHFDRALEAQPKNANAHYYRALAYLKTGELHKAEEGFAKAIELDAELTDARVHLGALYLAEPPRPDKAIAVLEPAVEAEPDAVDARDLLAFAYRLTGNDAKAAEQYEQAIKVKATPQLHFAYSDLLFEMGKAEPAAKHLRLALPGYEKDSTQLAAIADRFGQLKAFDDCISTFDKAVALDDKQPAFFTKRGLCKHGLDKEKEAQEDYLRALEIDPNFQPAHYYMGMSMLAANIRGKAVEHLEKAVKADKASAVGKKAQAKLDELKRKK